MSVIVPLYNSGPHLRALVASLDAQTMPAAQFEIVLVDDGSTDDTLEQARGIAATRPNVSVTAIPNSGWPGRPRNVGFDRARGEYVFFSDHDDEFFPEALERMWRTAVADRADVVYPKIVRVGAPTPYWALARTDVADADVVGNGLLISKTTHKLFRRAFLAGHGIRFREGRIRLEDHQFMGDVLIRNPRISVLASYPCYRWIHRNDGTNASSGIADLASYYDDLARSIEALQGEPASPALATDAAVHGAVRVLYPVRPAVWLAQDDEAQSSALSLARACLDRCVPADTDARQPLVRRHVLAAVRSGEIERFAGLQRLLSAWRNAVAVDDVRLDGRRMLVRASVRSLLPAGLTLEVDPVRQRLGGSLIDELYRLSGLPRTAEAVAFTPDSASLELTIRHRDSGVEWPLPAGGESPTAASAAPAPLRATCCAAVDVREGWFGGRLADGIWHLTSRSALLGEERTAPIRVSKDEAQARLPRTRLARDDVEAYAYRAAGGEFAVKVGPAGLRSPWPSATWVPRATSAQFSKDQLTLTFDRLPDAAESVVAVGAGDGAQREVAAAPLVDARATLRVPLPRRGEVVELLVAQDDTRRSRSRIEYAGADRPTSRGRELRPIGAVRGNATGAGVRPGLVITRRGGGAAWWIRLGRSVPGLRAVARRIRKRRTRHGAAAR